MKKIRVIMMSLAVVVAVGGAFASVSAKKRFSVATRYEILNPGPSQTCVSRSCDNVDQGNGYCGVLANLRANSSASGCSGAIDAFRWKP